MLKRWQKVLIVAWMALALAGALNHSVVPKLLNRRLQLWLPHLKYGFVMFNQNPRKVSVAYFKPRLSAAQVPVADLIQTPAPGYKLSRTNLNLFFYRNYMMYLCARAEGADGGEFILDTYRIDGRFFSVTTDYFRCSFGVLENE